jgi:GntR family transcriptional repressor for pyruvate dehydrogenase complex
VVQPVEKRSEAVHAQLRAAILSGELAPGDPLPSERTLAADHGVNRHAVREAMRRLQQAGLIQVTHGGATRVLDWRTHGGLELLTDLGGRLLRDVTEMRATIGADAAALCAKRAPEVVGTPRLDGSYDERLTAYEELWARILEGAGNVAYRLAFNSLVAARHGHGVDPLIYAAEIDDASAIERLVAAVASGDPERARRTARDLLERSVTG